VISVKLARFLVLFAAQQKEQRLKLQACGFSVPFGRPKGTLIHYLIL
jgi:hypothetical protein